MGLLRLYVCNQNRFNFDSTTMYIAQYVLKIIPLDNWNKEMNILELSNYLPAVYTGVNDKTLIQIRHLV